MSSLPRNGSHLLDEAAIYYTATNTFRNPIFDSYYSAASTGTFTGESNEARPPNEHHGQTMSARNQAQQSHPSRANASTAAEAALLFMSRTRQKWSDFCDSLAFSLKARAFIMETNFKRRVRALRKFLDRRLSSVCWLTSSVSDRRRRGDVYFARSGRSSRRRRASQQDGNSAANLMSLLQLELDQASLKRHQLATNQSSASKRNLFNLSEPISAKVLGAQQECILSRLECIKRHNQKIGNMQQSSIAEETHEAGESQADSDDVGPRGANQVDVPIWLSSASSSTWQEHPSCSDECHQSRGEGRLETRTKTTIATTTTPSSIPRPSNGSAAKTAGHWAAHKGSKPRAHSGSDDLKDKTCIICYERPPSIVTLPCEHSDICSDCFIEIIYMAVKNSQFPLRCVLCRQRVERIRCSRRLMLNVIRRNRSKVRPTSAGVSPLSSLF